MRGGERQRGASKREIDMTEHSAQHMFLLHPLLLQGLFDLSDFFSKDLTAHSLSHAGGSLSLSPSKPEREAGREEYQKTPSAVEKLGFGSFRIRPFFFFFYNHKGWFTSFRHRCVSSVSRCSPNTDG